MNPSAHWTVVREVISSTDTGAQVMGALPALVRRLLDEDAWQDFVTPDGRAQHYDRFTEFVEAHPPRGLGGRVKQLVALCGTDDQLARRVRTLALAEVEKAGPVGNPHGNDGATIITGHNTAERTVARLKRDDPELAARVVSGQVTPNAAAREKGWRKPRVVLTSPASVAVRLRQHFTPDQLAELRALLDDP